MAENIPEDGILGCLKLERRNICKQRNQVDVIHIPGSTTYG